MAGRPLTRARRAAEAAAKAAGMTLVPATPQPAPTTTIWNGAAPRSSAPPRAAPKPESPISGGGIRNAADNLGKPEEFDKLTGLCLSKAIEIMELELDPDHREFGRLLSLQSSITSSVFSVTSRINNEALRRAPTDKIGGLLDELKAASGEAPAEKALTLEDLF